MTKSRTLKTSYTGEDVEQQKLIHTAGNAKWYSPFRRQVGSLLHNQTYSSHTIQQSYTWYPKELKTNYPYKNLHMDIYSSFIHNCQNLEATKVPFGRQMDK